MVGRLLGGIATSILYSAFESWVIYEHHKVLHCMYLSSIAISCLIVVVFDSVYMFYVYSICLYSVVDDNYFLLHQHSQISCGLFWSL